MAKTNKILIFINVILICAFLYIFFHEDYDSRILHKLGLLEPTDAVSVQNPSTTTSEEIVTLSIHEKEMNRVLRGWINCLKKLNYDADVCFFGDSLTANSDFNKIFGGGSITCCNLGLSGDTLVGMAKRTDMITAVKPEKIFVMGGINAIKGKPVEDFIKEYEELLKNIKATAPDARIYVQSMLPVSKEQEEIYCTNDNIMKFNSEIEKLALNYGCVYINLYSIYEKDGYMDESMTTDGLHLKSEAYKLWADEIEKYIYG